MKAGRYSIDGAPLRLRVTIEIEVDPERWGQNFSGNGGLVTYDEVSYYAMATVREDDLIKTTGAKVKLIQTTAMRTPATDVSAVKS